MRKVSSAVCGALLLGFCVVTSSPLVAASPQQETTTQTRKLPQLTPKEKEAQKHYRIAQEALKNGDLATAEDELKTASTLAPNNALILYNLAVVESKSDHPDSALEHLHKAMRLGLPASQKGNADQLEAKLYKGPVYFTITRGGPAPAQAVENGAAQGEVKQPSDILEWLSTNAGVGLAMSTVVDYSGTQQFYTSLSSVTQLGTPCTLQIATTETVTVYPAPPYFTRTTRSTTLRMGDLVPDTIVISDHWSVLRFRTAGGRETIEIASTFSSSATSGSQSSQVHVNQFDLAATNQQYAERFKQAFDDLIKSCGGSLPKVTY